MEKISASMTVQEKDAAYARLAAQLVDDERVPQALRELAQDPRVTVRRGGAPGEGKCVVYWMQRAQRGRDNHALDMAIAVGNALGLPVVAYFAAISNFPHANLRHYAFLNQGLPDVEEDCAERGVGFVMRRAPHEDHLKFFADVDAAMVIGDENPMREPEKWRVRLAEELRSSLLDCGCGCDCAVEAAGEGAVQCGGGAAAAVSRAAGVSCAVYESSRRGEVEAAARTACGRCARGHYARVEGLRSQREAGGGVDGRTPCGGEAAATCSARRCWRTTIAIAIIRRSMERAR